MSVTADESARESRRAARQSIERAVGQAHAQLGIVLPEQKRPREIPSIPSLRRAPGRGVSDEVGMATLVDLGDGIFVWRDGFGPPPAGGSRRRRGGAKSPEPLGTVVTPVVFSKLEPNTVIKYLEEFDAWLTPRQGLRRWVGQGALRDWDGASEDAFETIRTPGEGRPKSQKRALLIVHGTFSQGKHLVQELRQTDEGRHFLKRSQTEYDEILMFDHPTLSVSPVLNGLDLALYFSNIKTPVDVVCHSRGGLVVRWWLEAFAGAGPGPRRVVMVGSPLAGTSLAAPYKLRETLGLFTSLGTFLEAAGTPFAAIPFTAVALGLLRVVKSIVGTLSHTPILDAAFAMIPGLHGQSRDSNNAELLRLRAHSYSVPPEYSFVRSDFQPDPVGWRFWRAFNDLGNRAKNLLFDAVFTEPNDLIVNTSSMTDLISTALPIKPGALLDFNKLNKGGSVHHTNYFSQPETADFLINRFQL